MTCIDKMIDDFRNVNYDINQWQLKMNDVSYTQENKDEFIQYIHYWKQKLRNTSEEDTISPSDKYICSDFIKLNEQDLI